MSDHESDASKDASGKAKNTGRRNLLVGSGALLVGGLAGRATAPQAATTSVGADGLNSAAPALPWTWPKIDPMEAGSRTYRAYLEQRG